MYARAGTIIGMRVLGIDAYPKGWIGIELDCGTFVAAHIGDRLTTLLSAVHDIQAVGIDMPLGLVETGRRRSVERPPHRHRPCQPTAHRTVARLGAHQHSVLNRSKRGTGVMSRSPTVSPAETS